MSTVQNLIKKLHLYVQEIDTKIKLIETDVVAKYKDLEQRIVTIEKAYMTKIEELKTPKETKK